MTVAEREELKALSLEVLGGENLWRKMLKGVTDQVKTPDGKPVFVPKSKTPVLKVTRKTEEDILADLRLLKKDLQNQIKSSIKDAEGKVSGGGSLDGQPEVP
jgi:hypothetical protein